MANVQPLQARQPTVRVYLEYISLRLDPPSILTPALAWTGSLSPVSSYSADPVSAVAADIFFSSRQRLHCTYNNERGKCTIFCYKTCTHVAWSPLLSAHTRRTAYCLRKHSLNPPPSKQQAKIITVSHPRNTRCIKKSRFTHITLPNKTPAQVAQPPKLLMAKAIAVNG